MKITKRFQFCASHRLHNPRLSVADNNRLFGKCNRQHGHNFILEVTVEGAAQRTSGMVIDFRQLSAIVQEQVIEYFDHTDFEQDIPEFKNMPQTVENLAIVVWQRLKKKMPARVRLARIRISESDQNWAEYEG